MDASPSLDDLERELRELPVEPWSTDAKAWKLRAEEVFRRIVGNGDRLLLQLEAINFAPYKRPLGVQYMPSGWKEHFEAARAEGLGLITALRLRLELDESVGVSVTVASPESDAWKDGYFKLFMSHISDHKAFAHDLSQALESFAISAFVAHDDITPTADWIQEIEKALFSANALVALLHPGFHDSKWTDQEVGAIMGRHLPIMSVKFETDPYGFLGKFQAFKGSDEPEEVASRIFRVLVKREDTKVHIARAVVHRTVNGTGHNDNQHNFGLLARISFLDRELADRLRQAMDESYYVARAYNKVVVMKTLFERFGFKLDWPESEVRPVEVI